MALRRASSVAAMSAIVSYIHASVASSAAPASPGVFGASGSVVIAPTVCRRPTVGLRRPRPVGALSDYLSAPADCRSVSSDCRSVSSDSLAARRPTREVSAAPRRASPRPPRRESAGAADERTGTRPGVAPVLEGRLPTLDRGEIADGVLHQAPASGRQVAHDLGGAELEVLVVDDVDIGEHAGLEGAAVAQPVEAGGVVGLLLHHPFERQPVAAGAVTGPVRQHERRLGRVADDTAV